LAGAGVSEVRTPRLDEEPPVPVPVAQAPVTVQHDHRAVLYTPDGKAIVRKAGF